MEPRNVNGYQQLILMRKRRTGARCLAGAFQPPTPSKILPTYSHQGPHALFVEREFDGKNSLSQSQEAVHCFVEPSRLQLGSVGGRRRQKAHQ